MKSGSDFITWVMGFYTCLWFCSAGGGCAWQGGGMCARGHVWQRGMCARGHVWHERWPLQWTVRILLECILVSNYYWFNEGFKSLHKFDVPVVFRSLVCRNSKPLKQILSFKVRVSVIFWILFLIFLSSKFIVFKVDLTVVEINLLSIIPGELLDQYLTHGGADVSWKLISQTDQGF